MLLASALIDAVLARLGVGVVRNDREGLRLLYGAWCESIAFDNVQKLVHLEAKASSPLPGSTPESFFRAWLEHGTGGTCWAGNGALHALVSSLGFAAERGVATMMVSPDAKGPNHGTVVVTLDGDRFVVDASILSGEPLRLPEPAGTIAIVEDARIPRIDVRDGVAYVVWRTPRSPEGFLCRIDRIGVDDEEWDARHQATAGWGPFNFSVAARVNRGRGSISYGGGERHAFDDDGVLRSRPVDRAGRDRFLVEELRMSEAIVRALPEDRPMPPPPA